MKPKYVKDHVTAYGKHLKKETQNKYGINPALIMRALKGDDKAVMQISDMGKTGERILHALPTIKTHLETYIQGITDYNTAIADIYKQGGKGAFEIDKAGTGLAVEQTKIRNKIEEFKAKKKAELERENVRHDDAMEVIALNAWIDEHMKSTEHQANLEGISNKPMLAQMRADNDYSTKKLDHQLEHGSESNLDLIPRKVYSTNPLVKFWNEVRQIFS